MVVGESFFFSYFASFRFISGLEKFVLHTIFVVCLNSTKKKSAIETKCVIFIFPLFSPSPFRRHLLFLRERNVCVCVCIYTSLLRDRWRERVQMIPLMSARAQFILLQSIGSLKTLCSAFNCLSTTTSSSSLTKKRRKKLFTFKIVCVRCAHSSCICTIFDVPLLLRMAYIHLVTNDSHALKLSVLRMIEATTTTSMK